MAFDSRKVTALFDSAMRIWSKVKPVYDHSSTVLEPFSKLFIGISSADPMKYAGDSLKTCVEVSTAFRKFTRTFQAPGINRWKDGGTILAEFTNASVGRKAENQQAVLKLRQLADTLGEFKTLASAGKDFTSLAKIFDDLQAVSSQDSLAMYSNQLAAMRATNDFNSLITSSDQILPNVKSAIQMAEAMAR